MLFRSPGWTLPGVYALGGAQIALKAQGCAIGRRVAFLGAGPLLPLVACQYLDAGVDVAAVLDATPFLAKLRGAGSPDALYALFTADAARDASLARAESTMRVTICSATSAAASFERCPCRLKMRCLRLHGRRGSSCNILTS